MTTPCTDSGPRPAPRPAPAGDLGLDTLGIGAPLEAPRWARVLAFGLGAWAALWMLCTPAHGQQQPGIPGQTGSDIPGPPVQQLVNNPYVNPVLGYGYLPPFFSSQQSYDQLFPVTQLPDLQQLMPSQGLPIFPQDLQSYDGPMRIQVDGTMDLRPFGGGLGGLTNLPLVAPAPLVVRRNDWPEVIRLQLGALDPNDPSSNFAPDRAVTVRNGGRLWVTLGDEPPVPRDWNNKLAVVFTGDRVATRTFGKFQTVFQDGALMRAQGVNAIVFAELSAEARRIRLERVDRLQWYGSTAGCELILPEGSRVLVAASEPGSPHSDLFLEQRDGLLWVLNRGPATAELQSPFGVWPLPRGARVAVLPADPGGAPVPGALVVEGSLRVTREGRILRAVGLPGGGALVWCGVRIPVAAGAAIQLDPLGGDSFPDELAIAPEAAPDPAASPDPEAAPEASGAPDNEPPGDGSR